MRDQSRPYFIGMALGLLLCASIVTTVIWLPSIWRKENEWLVRLIFFTTSLFFVLISTNWRFRNHPKLWIAIAILALVHAILIIRFMDRVRELRVRDYAVILFVETFLGGLVVNKTLDGPQEDPE
jgi:phosphatidylserine synthase